MDITKMIKIMLIEENMTQTDLAEKLNTTQGNLSNKFKRNNFSVNEMLDIANALNRELKIEFIKK